MCVRGVCVCVCAGESETSLLLLLFLLQHSQGYRDVCRETSQQFLCRAGEGRGGWESRGILKLLAAACRLAEPGVSAFQPWSTPPSALSIPEGISFAA